MLKRIVTAALVVALACTAGAAPALANTPAEPAADAVATGAPAAEGLASEKEVASGEKLKDNFARLVADARAGKVGVTTTPRRQQPAQGNNLSKGAKITIAVVAAIVITAVVIAAKANDAPGDIRIF